MIGVNYIYLFINNKNNNWNKKKVVRNSLLPGIFKTIAQNKKMALPLKVFEVSDVVFKDDTYERKARNQRNMAAVYTNKTAGFEVSR